MSFFSDNNLSTDPNDWLPNDIAEEDRDRLIELILDSRVQFARSGAIAGAVAGATLGVIYQIVRGKGVIGATIGGSATTAFMLYRYNISAFFEPQLLSVVCLSGIVGGAVVQDIVF